MLRAVIIMKKLIIAAVVLSVAVLSFWAGGRYGEAAVRRHTGLRVQLTPVDND